MSLAETMRSRRYVLEEEAACPRSQRREYVLVDIEGGQHEHPDPGCPRVGGYLPGRLNAVQQRHPDVHEQHIRTLPAGQRDRLFPGGCLPGELHVTSQAELDPEAISHQRLIIGNRHPDGHPASCSL
jgi:hypothetical protein